MALMTMPLVVEYEDGTTTEVVADQRDAAAWEAEPFGWPMSQIEQRAGMLFTRYMAWHALKRTKVTELGWEAWDEVAVEAMPTEEADAPDPGNPAAPDAGS